MGPPFAVDFTATQDRMTLVELPGFLAKNWVLTGSSLVKIPALMTRQGTFDLDHSLCLV